MLLLVPALMLGQMSGLYVIGTGGSYTTFYAAASALSSNGVDGPVTFNVLNGTYDGDFTLNSISGTSETNTVTFQSYSGDAEDVVLTDSYYYASYVVKFYGADYVTFKNITFDRSTTGSGYTKLIEIRSGTDYITFDNCVFKGYNHNNSSTNYSLIYTYNSDQYDGIVIKNCTFTDGGGYAIDLRNGSTGGTGLEIINNTFTDTYGGIYAKYFDAVTIRGNTIKGAGLYDTGIRLDYCDGANAVEDNSIYGPDMTYGIYLNYCQATSGSEATIINNLISVEDYGIYMYTYNTYQNVYYNSVQVTDSNALFYHSNNDQFDSKNNIFASSASPALYVNNSTGFTSNYNDLFSNYTYPVYYDGNKTFAEYQVPIQYTPGSFFIGSSDGKDELFLTHEEQELGVYTIMAQPGQSKLVIPIEIRGRDASISIRYKGITSQGEVAGKMTRSMTIENIPDEFVLYSNYPNPFNPITKIDYGLPEASNVQLIIYDILGREVTTLVNGMQEPGYKLITWHGTNAFGKKVGAGMYFYLIQAGDFRQVKKLVLLK